MKRTVSLKTSQIVVPLLLLCFSFVQSGCGGGSATLVSPDQSVSVVAKIVDQDGNPVPGASVTVDGATQMSTDAQGEISITAATANGEASVKISASRGGYIECLDTIVVDSSSVVNGVFNKTLVMRRMPSDAASATQAQVTRADGSTVSVTPTVTTDQETGLAVAVTTVTVAGDERAVVFSTPASESSAPARASLQLGDPSGAGANAAAVLGTTGEITGSVTYGDPTSAQDLAMFPGEFATEFEGTPQALVTAGFARINLQDANGNSITQFGDGNRAKVTMRVPTGIQNPETGSTVVAGDTIPVFVFNEGTGEWVIEYEGDGSIKRATVQQDADGLFVEFEVSHLSWWNLDFKTDVCPSGEPTLRFVDEAGRPISGVTATLEIDSGWEDSFFSNRTRTVYDDYLEFMRAPMNIEFSIRAEKGVYYSEPVTIYNCAEKTTGEKDFSVVMNTCTPVCTTDADCADTDSLTIDACENRGTCSAVCTNTPCDVACSADADCDDGDSLTMDSCSNPGTCGAACVNTTCSVPCTTDLDCNDNDPNTGDSCDNAGTCDAACSNVACSVACFADTACDDGDPLTIDTCTSPGSCSAACSNVPCSAACSADADCDDADPFTTDTCNNPATCDAACTNTPCSAACQNDADCDDSNALTSDVCNSAGTCSAACVNTPCTAACSADIDCDDADSSTIDTCSAPATCDASCINSACPVTCGSDIDCDDSDPGTADTCNSPGACDSSCSYFNLAEVVAGVTPSAGTPIDTFTVSCCVTLNDDTLNSLDIRCDSGGQWYRVESPMTDESIECIYDSVGSYTPGCRINETITDDVDSSISISEPLSGSVIVTPSSGITVDTFVLTCDLSYGGTGMQTLLDFRCDDSESWNGVNPMLVDMGMNEFYCYYPEPGTYNPGCRVDGKDSAVSSTSVTVSPSFTLTSSVDPDPGITQETFTYTCNVTLDGAENPDPLDMRCDDSQDWHSVDSMSFMNGDNLLMCNYSSAGTYTPGCRVDGYDAGISSTSVTVEDPVLLTASISPMSGTRTATYSLNCYTTMNGAGTLTALEYRCDDTFSWDAMDPMSAMIGDNYINCEYESAGNYTPGCRVEKDDATISSTSVTVNPLEVEATMSNYSTSVGQDITLTCTPDIAYTILYGRCDEMDPWTEIASGTTMTCNYGSAGIFSPGCNVDDTSMNNSYAPVNVDTTITLSPDAVDWGNGLYAIDCNVVSMDSPLSKQFRCDSGSMWHADTMGMNYCFYDTPGTYYPGCRADADDSTIQSATVMIDTPDYGLSISATEVDPVMSPGRFDIMCNLGGMDFPDIVEYRCDTNSPWLEDVAGNTCNYSSYGTHSPACRANQDDSYIDSTSVNYTAIDYSLTVTASQAAPSSYPGLFDVFCNIGGMDTPLITEFRCDATSAWQQDTGMNSCFYTSSGTYTPGCRTDEFDGSIQTDTATFSDIVSVTASISPTSGTVSDSYTLTCDVTDPYSIMPTLDMRCSDTDQWFSIAFPSSGVNTITCAYSTTGTYTPGCRLDDSIIDDADTSLIITP